MSKTPTKKPVQLAGANSKAEEGLVKVQHMNDFYRAGDKKLFTAAVVIIVGAIIQVFVAFMGFTAKNERVYIATNNAGSLINLVALNLPNQKDPVVAQWVQNALVDTFDFNFENWERRLNESTSEWFTDKGREALLKAMKSAGNIDAVVDRKMLMSLTLDHTPIKVSGVNYQGIYTWTFQVPAVLTYRTQSQELSNKVLFTVTVERRSVMDNAEGLGISKVVMTKRI